MTEPPSEEFEEVSFYPEATSSFVHDIYVRGYHLTSLPGMTGEVKFTILAKRKVIRQYQKYASVDVYEFVVMDGNLGIFKCILNSGQSGDLQDESELVPGTTIMLVPEEWKMIQSMNEKDGTLRAILFLQKFDWSPAPNRGEADDNSAVTPDFHSMWIDKETVQDCRIHHPSSATQRQ